MQKSANNNFIWRCAVSKILGLTSDTKLSNSMNFNKLVKFHEFLRILKPKVTNS